jgi:hypothetical protein
MIPIELIVIIAPLIKALFFSELREIRERIPNYIIRMRMRMNINLLAMLICEIILHDVSTMQNLLI